LTVAGATETRTLPAFREPEDLPSDFFIRPILCALGFFVHPYLEARIGSVRNCGLIIWVELGNLAVGENFLLRAENFIDQI
jgi:hypothetical protein